MKQRLSIAITLVLTAALIGETLGESVNIKEQCFSLQRPNVDCECVGAKLAAMHEVTASASVREWMTASYLNALGQSSDIDRATSAASNSRLEIEDAEMSLRDFGGVPKTIADFERGCLKFTTQQVQLSEPKKGTAADLYVRSGIEVLGAGAERYLYCVADLLNIYLTEDEYRAFQLSYSHEDQHSTTGDAELRARRMGVALSAFESLERSAREKVANNYTRDQNYCEAITYAEQFTMEQIADEADWLAPLLFAEIVVAPATLDKEQSMRDTKLAETLVLNDCENRGNTIDVCNCVLTDFKQKIVAQAARANVILTWVVLYSGVDLDPEFKIETMANSDPLDRSEALRLNSNTQSVGQHCY